jgi:signal transduction histidine kinase/ligand-binding sensor domain-containing protein
VLLLKPRRLIVGQSLSLMRRFAAAQIVFLWCMASAAQTFAPAISQMSHSAWRLQDGAFPDAPETIAQTSDGYLWLGTESGIVRFDGVRFVKGKDLIHDLPSFSVHSLMGASDGTLWIGAGSGLARWRNSTFSYVPKIQGHVNAIVSDALGTVWVAQTRYDKSGGPLCRIKGDTSECFGTDQGLRCIYGQALALDPQGNIWMGSNPGVCKWTSHGSSLHNSTKDEEGKSATGVQGLVVAPNGHIFVGFYSPGPGVGLQELDGDQAEHSSPILLNKSSLGVADLMFDHAGGLWIGTLLNGVYHIVNGVMDHYGAADGLSSDQVNKIFEDHEGSVWVATSGGLDRFRPLKVVPFSSREGLVSDQIVSVVSMPGGGVAIGAKGGLNLLQGNQLTTFKAGRGLPGELVTAMLVDHSGTLWVGIDAGLFRMERGNFHQVLTEDGKQPGTIAGLIEDPQHEIWALTSNRPPQMFRVVGDRLRAIPIDRPLIAMMTPDSKDGYWVLLDHDLLRYQSGAYSVVKEAIKDYIISGMRVDQHGDLWVWGSAGLLHERNGHWDVLNSKNGLPCNGVGSVLEDGNGTWWLSTFCGMIAIPGAQLDAWASNTLSVVNPQQAIDVVDGAHMAEGMFGAGAALSTDGKLWFANARKLQMLDPLHVPFNPHPPPVHIEQITADGRVYALDRKIVLPPLTRQILIDYTALSLVDPQRVRFRYQIAGVDTRWQEAGQRRQAFYMNLGPGSYYFQVLACNNDGVWNLTGDSVHFDIRPAYYQTLWFRCLLALLCLVSLGLFVALRMRRISRLLQDRLEARYLERLRIARDLHDTLIQGVQGLSAHVHAVMERVSGNDNAKKEMETVLERADSLFTEGRDRLRDLRSEIEDIADLESSLTRYISENFEESTTRFIVVVNGTPILLRTVALDEILWIAREAMLNANMHAFAKTVEVDIDYGKSGLRVVIRDDGRGLDPAILSIGNRAGHWGLPGMRERAESIGGKLKIASVRPHGTEVEVSLPAAIAFAKPKIRPRSALGMLFRLRYPKDGSSGT